MSIKSQIKKLPEKPGIYIFTDEDGKILYVGKSVSIKKRVSSYFSSKNLGPKTNMLVKKINTINHVEVFSEFEALLLESELIRKNKPFFNIQAKDDKSPIYIKITKGEVPLISVTRQTNVEKGTFIKGPFPSGRTTKDILRLTRRIFPYCHHKNAKKPCLYVHLGLCPYPYESNESKDKYKKTVKKIKKLLNGGTKFLIRDLAKEMTALSKQQRYEEANHVKKQIEKLEYLTTTYHAPHEFLQNPSLVDDLSTQKIKDLSNELGLDKLPKRIECYDIANTSGKQATGSMVVFINGKSSKADYRRFKIKLAPKPNDYEMIREVLTRRFKNDWPIPDLLVIDGGRGQLNTALSVISKSKIKTKAVSLAKRLEEIYTPEQILPIRLPKERPARQLMQEIRDEAHRFANTYHRLLRSKNMISS